MGADGCDARSIRNGYEGISDYLWNHNHGMHIRPPSPPALVIRQRRELVAQGMLGRASGAQEREDEGREGAGDGGQECEAVEPEIDVWEHVGWNVTLGAPINLDVLAQMLEDKARTTATLVRVCVCVCSCVCVCVCARARARVCVCIPHGMNPNLSDCSASALALYVNASCTFIPHPTPFTPNHPHPPLHMYTSPTLYTQHPTPHMLGMCATRTLSNFSSTLCAACTYTRAQVSWGGHDCPFAPFSSPWAAWEPPQNGRNHSRKDETASDAGQANTGARVGSSPEACGAGAADFDSDGARASDAMLQPWRGLNDAHLSHILALAPATSSPGFLALARVRRAYVSLLASLAQMLSGEGHPAAEVVLKRALQLDPQHPACLSNYASLLEQVLLVIIGWGSAHVCVVA